MTDASEDGDEPSPAEIYEQMDPLEPYTTAELAAAMDIPTELVRTLLESLAEEDTIRKKEPEPKRAIWIRKPPANTCPNCGRTFEVRFLHPVLGRARYCPRCGTSLND